MNKSILTIAAALLVGLVAPAQAGTWNFDYSGAGVSTSFTVTTGSALTTFEGNPGYYVTGITGQRNGVAITGLVPAANDAATGFSTSPDGRWWFDNVLLSSGGFDLYGLLFTTQDGGEYNLYKQNGQYIDGYYNTNTRSYNLISVALNVPDSGIPLALIGATLLGLATLRRRFFAA